MSEEIISFIDFTNMSDEEKYKILNSKDYEIERLNNIINKFDKVIIEFKKQIEEERKNYCEIIGNFVDKVRELKGDDK